MSTIAEHLAELEMLDASRTQGVSGPMVQAGYMFLIVHYAEMIQERDPAEMAKARESTEQRLREQHPARAEEIIASWRAARPPLRDGVSAVDAHPAPFSTWAAGEGYDIAQTYDTERSRWVFLNPMTADLWKAWQAARGVGDTDGTR